MPARTAEDCDRLFAEHVNAGALDAVVALYEPTAAFVPQGEPAVHGAAAIRKELAALIEARPTMEMHVTRAVPAGDDLAVLYNDWRMTARAPDGAEIVMTGKALEICRRQADGTWRFVLDDPFARG